MDGKKKIYSVSELNRAARFTLENSLGEVWVEGEVSRLTRHASGHWYFTLKDAGAAVSCAMFKQHNDSVLFSPKDGLSVRVLGQASLYEPRGSYQLIVRTMEEAGKGALQEQFEKLKAKLAAEGLFDASRKKPLPLLPQKIGIVTSPTGAAVRDILHVLTRRFPNLEILLAPVTVQGDGAAKSIAAAIAFLNTYNQRPNERDARSALPIDLIIVGRGGGSIEDLWAFNEEVVARAIAASHIPVISAVGHEIDFTISDFVADVRAPTPSAAAELAVPLKAELDAQLTRLSARLQSSLRNKAQVLREQIPVFRKTLLYALTHHLRRRQQQVDETGRALADLLTRSLAVRRQSLPAFQQTLTHRLESALADRKQRLCRYEAQLRALNPLAVLNRGYSLTCTEDGAVVRDAAVLKPGERLKTRVAQGSIFSEVKKTEA
jgi:exodeoxyribonuclease VII large subunit